MKTELVVYDSLPTLLSWYRYKLAKAKVDKTVLQYQRVMQSYNSVLNLLSQEFYSLVSELNGLVSELNDLYLASSEGISIPASFTPFPQDYKELLDASMAKRLFWSLANKFHPDKPGGNKELFQRLVAAKDDLQLLNILFLTHIDSTPTEVNVRKLEELAEAFDVRLQSMRAKPEWLVVGAYNARNRQKAKQVYKQLLEQAIVVQKQRISWYLQNPKNRVKMTTGAGV